MRQLPQYKERSVLLVNPYQLLPSSLRWSGTCFTLTKRWWRIPLVKPVWVEPAGGIAWTYQAVTTVAKELKSATRTKFGSVDHTAIRWRIINTAIGSWRHTETKTETEEEKWNNYQTFWIKGITNTICVSSGITVRAIFESVKKMKIYDKGYYRRSKKIKHEHEAIFLSLGRV